MKRSRFTKERRDAFAQLVEALARVRQGDAELLSIDPDSKTAYHLSDYFVSEDIRQHLGRQLPEASKIFSEDVSKLEGIIRFT
jgi:hypothetical protein